MEKLQNFIREIHQMLVLREKEKFDTILTVLYRKLNDPISNQRKFIRGTRQMLFFLSQKNGIIFYTSLRQKSEKSKSRNLLTPHYYPKV